MGSNRAMVIGLGPEYNYPGLLAEWQFDNTKYASNHGASFISRALAKQFDADFVDNFADVPQLRNKYDLCIVALASHISTKRDIGFYADIIEKLDMKTVAFSMGVQDYIPSTSEVPALHPSVLRFLRAVSNRSEYIGVRGKYTASILSKYGFRNVVPIGCPTVFWNMKPTLEINKPNEFKKPLLTYHRTVAGVNRHLLDGPLILGHDFLDEAVLTDNLNHDTALQQLELREYKCYEGSDKVLELLKTRSLFPPDFATWFSAIGSSDFVFGPRLHGCIAALVQGIPALLFTRDLRTQEMAEGFDIPCVDYPEARRLDLKRAYEEADYQQFSKTYKLRYLNYIQFLTKLGLILTDSGEAIGD